MRFLVLVCLAGCTTILGLDETEPESNDLDRDGVADDRDNCPGIANPEQRPTDCDTIANEDGDAISDAKDLCPGVADDQADSDRDAVGDACDLAGSLEQRRLFDGFVGNVFTAVWMPTPEWTVANGNANSIGDGMPLVARDVVVQGNNARGTWFVLTTIELPPTAPDGARLALRLFQTNQTLICGFELDAAAGGWVIVFEKAGVEQKSAEVYTGTQPIRIQTWEPSFIGLPQVACGVSERELLLFDDMAGLGPYRVSLLATTTGSFRHVDVVGRRD